MTGKVLLVVAAMATALTGAPAAAQDAPQDRDAARELARQRIVRPRVDPMRESRYQIGVMERVLEDAVEHGFNNWRDRLQAVLPAQTVLLDNARARGYRLDGYGVFFNVEVPSLETTWFSVFRTLDQNGLGLENALKTMKGFVEASGDANLKQALQRIELQVAPAVPPGTLFPGEGARTASGSAALPPSDGRTRDDVDPILNDPETTYRLEVIQALRDALLDHGPPLDITADEWLTIGARRNEVRPRIAPADSSARTIIIRLRGLDLGAFRAGRLSREEAVKRVEVRVF